MKGIIWVVVIVIAVILGFVFLGGSPEEATGEPIKIGWIGPLTGGAAFVGEESKNATQIAVNEINENGGVDGRPIEIIYEDGQCNGTDSVSAIQKLANIDKVSVIFGGTCSPETLAISPIAESNQILLFTSYSTSPDVTNAGDFVFRNSPSDLVSASAVADIAKENGHLNISVVAANTDFGKSFADVFGKKLAENGGEVVSTNFYSPETKDFRSHVVAAVANSPQAIAIFPQGEAGGLFVKQLRESGYEGPLYGSHAMAGDTIEVAGADNVEGLYYADQSEPDEGSRKISKYLDKYLEIYGDKPQFGAYAVAQYDAVYLMAEAIEEVGYDSAKIRDYLYQNRFSDGIGGKISFDENGDAQGLKFSWFQITGGESVELE